MGVGSPGAYVLTGSLCNTLYRVGRSRDGRILLSGQLERPQRVLRVLHRMGAFGQPLLRRQRPPRRFGPQEVHHDRGLGGRLRGSLRRGNVGLGAVASPRQRHFIAPMLGQLLFLARSEGREEAERLDEQGHVLQEGLFDGIAGRKIGGNSASVVFRRRRGRQEGHFVEAGGLDEDAGV